MTYRNMTARQLRSVAPSIGLTGASRKTKDEIVSWIEQNAHTLDVQAQQELGLADADGNSTLIHAATETVTVNRARRPKGHNLVADQSAVREVPQATSRVAYDPGADMSSLDRRSRRSLNRYNRRHNVRTIRPLAQTPPVTIVTTIPRAQRKPGAMVPLVIANEPTFDRGYESGGDRRARRAAARAVSA